MNSTYTVALDVSSDLDTSYFSLKTEEKVLKFCGNPYLYKDSENLECGRQALNFACIHSHCAGRLQYIPGKNSINITTAHTLKSCTIVFTEWSQKVPALTKTKIKPEDVGHSEFQSDPSCTSKQASGGVKLKKSRGDKRHCDQYIDTLQGGIVDTSPQELDVSSSSSSPSQIAATPAHVLRPIQPPLLAIPSTPLPRTISKVQQRKMGNWHSPYPN